MHEAAHEGSRTQDHRAGTQFEMELGLDSADSIVFHQERGGVSLVKINSGGGLQQVLHAELVGLLIALGPRCAHARSLPGIEESPLDRGGIGIQSHRSAQGIDLADHVSLPETSDGGVAAHLANGVQVLGQDRNLGAKAGRRQGGLHAGVPGAHHQDVVLFGITKHNLLARGRETSSLWGNIKSWTVCAS